MVSYCYNFLRLREGREGRVTLKCSYRDKKVIIFFFVPMLDTCEVRVNDGEVEGVDERGVQLVLPLLYLHLFGFQVQSNK